jgi:DNA modification methylase
MMNYQVLTGDCVQGMMALEDKSVHTCVTSPPYFGLRDYGHGDQIGLEGTPDLFVEKMVHVFREVRRVLRNDGTLWLNLGDSYASAGGHSSIGTSSQRTGRANIEVQNARKGYAGGGEIKQKDLIGIPWMVAFALRSDGWYLRQDIIWHKPNPMPESVRDRCTKAHEYIFMFSKSARYHYDSEAIREKSVTNDNRRPYGSKGAWDMDGRPKEKQHGGKQRTDKQRGHGRRHDGFNDRWDAMSKEEQGAMGRNKRSVWSVATRPYKGAHFATFPPALITPCVLAGCPVGGTVLDPFGGSGTTAEVALRNKRNAILCELNPTYVDLIHQRLAPVVKSIQSAAAQTNLFDTYAPAHPL